MDGILLWSIKVPIPVGGTPVPHTTDARSRLLCRHRPVTLALAVPTCINQHFAAQRACLRDSQVSGPAQSSLWSPIHSGEAQSHRRQVVFLSKVWAPPPHRCALASTPGCCSVQRLVASTRTLLSPPRVVRHPSSHVLRPSLHDGLMLFSWTRDVLMKFARMRTNQAPTSSRCMSYQPLVIISTPTLFDRPSPAH